MTVGGIGKHGIRVGKHFKHAVGAWALAASSLFGNSVLANPKPGQLNITPGVTTYSNVPYMLNNVALGVCVVIGILVFGAMFIAMFRFRKSRGAVAEKWSHNTAIEIVWTTIPVIILVCLAWLATDGLRKFSDTTGAQMTVKVTGYQWKWRYDYVDYLGKPVSHVGSCPGWTIAATPPASWVPASIRMRSRWATRTPICWTSIIRWWCRSAPRSAS